MHEKILTLDSLDLRGKKVFLRVDMNTPIHPKTGELVELSRIEEAAVTIRDLGASKVVVASHQGRVGRYDYTPMDKHAAALSKILGKEVKYVEDVFGEAARKRIDEMETGQVLLLDNLRFTAEENVEFDPQAAQKTVFVRRLSPHLEACVLDAFSTAHRAHPSIVGFAEVMPTCAGRVVAKELLRLERIFAVEKGPYVTVLGGAKVGDRVEAIEALIANRRADKVLLCGLVALLFLKAQGKFNGKIEVEGGDQKWLGKARQLMSDYPDAFELPLDLAADSGGERREVKVGPGTSTETPFLDIGSETMDHYSRLIKGAGTVFMSGPPGAFEYEEFSKGTEVILRALASSLATTIVSGGHLSAALHRFKIEDSIDHVSTAGGALVQYLAGNRLPLIDALERSARKWSD